MTPTQENQEKALSDQELLARLSSIDSELKKFHRPESVDEREARLNRERAAIKQLLKTREKERTAAKVDGLLPKLELLEAESARLQARFNAEAAKLVPLARQIEAVDLERWQLKKQLQCVAGGQGLPTSRFGESTPPVSAHLAFQNAQRLALEG